MASTRRNTIQVNLVRVPPQLKDLASRVPESSPFTDRHGRLINLVTSNSDEEMIKVLFQFFEMRRHSYEVNLDSIPASGSHVLQNDTKISLKNP